MDLKAAQMLELQGALGAAGWQEQQQQEEQFTPRSTWDPGHSSAVGTIEGGMPKPYRGEYNVWYEYVP